MKLILYFLFSLAGILFTSAALHAQNRGLNKKQAVEDIDSLVSGIKQIHPDMFAVCSQKEFEKTLTQIKKELPDTLSAVDLYWHITPLTTLLGDAHTDLYRPKVAEANPSSLSWPLYVRIDKRNAQVTVKDMPAQLDTTLIGAQIVSINGIATSNIVNRMLKYAAGEKMFYRLHKVEINFLRYMQLLYPAKEYTVCFTQGKKKFTHTLPTLPLRDIKGSKTVEKRPYYALRLLEKENMAILEFNAFTDPQRFACFADSIFTVLKEKQIQHLIIDIRNNGGGNSGIGDELFQYISPVPFLQFGKIVSRVSRLQQACYLKLVGDTIPMSRGMHIQNDIPLEELQTNPLRYQGKVYLLISHSTFSSASSFSWTFKQFGMGKVIGEESGGMNVCFGDMVFVQLPNSKITSSVSWKRFWQYGADEKDIHGTLPDIKIPAEKALDYTIQLIRGKE